MPWLEACAVSKRKLYYTRHLTDQLLAMHHPSGVSMQAVPPSIRSRFRRMLSSEWLLVAHNTSHLPFAYKVSDNEGRRSRRYPFCAIPGARTYLLHYDNLGSKQYTCGGANTVVWKTAVQIVSTHSVPSNGCPIYRLLGNPAILTPWMAGWHCSS